MRRLSEWIGTLIAICAVVVPPQRVEAQVQTHYLGKSVAEWGRDLDNSQAATRRTAAFALGKLGPSAAGFARKLSERLDDADEGVREAAAFALGQIGPPANQVAQAKLEALVTRDASPAVRRSAVYALGNLGDAGAASAGVLVRALQDADASVRQNAAFALGQLGPGVLVQHTGQLAALLRDQDPLVRRDAAVALGKGGAASAVAVPSLIEALNDADTGVRLNAANALGQIGPAAAAAIPALTRMIRERTQDRDVWREAVIALPKIGTGDGDEIIPAMRPALQHNDPAIRKSAALALFQHVEAPAAQGCLVEMAGLLKDPDVHVRRTAAAFLSKAMKEPNPAYEQFWNPLIQVLQEEQDPEVRLFVARCFRAFDLQDPSKKQGRAVLFRLAVNDKQTIVRYQLAYLLAGMLGPDARDVTPTLIELLKDKRIGLVDKTLGTSGVQGGEARGGGTRIEETPQGDGRVLGAQGLGWIGKVAGPAAQRALEEAARDPTSPKLRQAASQALLNFR